MEKFKLILKICERTLAMFWTWIKICFFGLIYGIIMGAIALQTLFRNLFRALFYNLRW